MSKSDDKILDMLNNPEDYWPIPLGAKVRFKNRDASRTAILTQCSIFIDEPAYSYISDDGFHGNLLDPKDIEQVFDEDKGVWKPCEFLGGT